MGLSKSTSLIIIYLGFLFFLAYPIVKFIPVITAESQNFTRYIPKIEAFVKDKYEEIIIIYIVTKLKIAIKSKERNNNNCIQQQFEYINNCI